MFTSIQFRTPILFLIGFLVGGTIASIAVLSIAAILDANTDTEATHRKLETLSEKGPGLESRVDLHADYSEFLDSIDDTAQPRSRFASKEKLYSKLLQADADLLVDLLDRSQDLSKSIWRREIQTAIHKRLATIDPARAIDQARMFSVEQRLELIESVFGEWSLLNPRDAIDAGQRLKFPEKKLALEAILRFSVDLPEEQRLAIGRSFGHEDYSRRLIEVDEAMALINTPRRAWEAVIGDGLDMRFRLDSVVDIAQSWVRKDGIGVLGEILAREPDNLGISALDLTIIRSIVRADPEEVFTQVVSDPDLRFLLAEIATVWTETDPIAALGAVSLLNDVSETRLLTWSIMWAWSETNPRELLQERALLPSEMEVHAMSAAIGTIAKTAPLEAVGLIENLRTEGVNTWPVAKSLADAWSEHDPEANLEWVLSGSNDQNPQFGGMVEVAVSRLVHVDPERAMSMALNPLSPRWPRDLDYSVIRELSSTDIDSARKLLKRVSDSSRIKSYKRVGFKYVEGGNPEHAIELAEQLAASEQEAYYSATLDTWAITDPDELLEAMEHFPSSNVQTLAARKLIQRNEERHFFTEQQVKRVESYLNGEDDEW